MTPRRGWFAWLYGTAGWVLLLTALLIGGVVAVRIRTPTLLATVKIAVGSEDMPFFQDPAVVAEFKANRLNVIPTPMGSGLMINAARSGIYDAVLPSSDVYYRLTRAALPKGHYIIPYPVFQTPLAVFTRDKYIPVLKAAGFIDAQGQFNIGTYLTRLRTAAVTWNQYPGLPSSNPLVENKNKIVLQTTDPNDSDSGALFSAYAAYLFNGRQPVSDDQQLAAVTPKISPEFIAEGNAPASTQYVFINFLNGSSPLVVGYQSEATDTSPQPGQSFPRSDGRYLPLSGGGVDAVHTLLALNADGHADKLGSLLQTDPVLLDREKAHGFNRPTGGVFAIPAAQWLSKLITDVDPNG